MSVGSTSRSASEAISVSGTTTLHSHPLRHHNDHNRGGVSRREAAASASTVASDGKDEGCVASASGGGCTGGPVGNPAGNGPAGPSAAASTSSTSSKAATARTKSGVASKSNNSSSFVKKQSNNIHSASPMQPHNTSKYPGRSTVPGYTRYLLNKAIFKISLVLKIDQTH